MNAIWTSIKNDPIIKAVTIIILGVLGFGFAFNMMFGQRSSMDGGEMSGGYSFNNNLSYWLTSALKLLLIALALYAVIAIIKLLGKYLLKGGEPNVNHSEKNDTLIKSIVAIVLVVLAIGLLIAIFGGSLGLWNGFNVHGRYMMGSYGGSYGIMDGSHSMMGGYGNGYPGFMNGSYNGTFIAGNNGLNLSFILVLLLKILLVVSIVGLIAGLGLFLYKSLEKASDEQSAPIRQATIACPACNAGISNEFKFCPECGAKTS